MTPQRVPVPWWADRREHTEDHRPPAARGRGARRGFGDTWWGRAWVDALEHRAALDPNRLPRGRSYARRGSVGGLEISPGLVRAQVQGSRARPYEVTVRVRAFDAGEWDQVLSVVAASLGRTAALLDGELPPELAGDVAAAGLDLLPGAGEVQPRCSCPDWADPCKHAAAVCYLVADELDADPFALLRLRGRTREEVLAALRTRRAAGSSPAPGGRSRTEPAGVLAREAFAGGRAGAPVPPVPLPPPRPGRPAVLGVDPPPESGLRTQDLTALAADAARRAWELATGDGDGGLGLTREQDLARRAVAALQAGRLAELAAAAGMPARELTSEAIAWRVAGAAGLSALRESWRPAPDELADGREALQDVGGSSSAVTAARVRDNRVTRGTVQLRLGRDGLWYRFSKRGAGWDLDGPGDPDPRVLLG